MGSEDRLDLIIFGVTGYTGKYCLRNIVSICETEQKQYTFGIAGRNKTKVQDVLTEIADELNQPELVNKVPVIQANVDDNQSLLDMTRRCKVLVNAVGPYILYGRQVVEACIETGTHHVDLSGEPSYLESVQVDLYEKAKEAGIYCVGACGFDSVPSDLGVQMLKDSFKDIQFNEVESFLSTNEPAGKTINHGTFDSVVCAIVHWQEMIKAKILNQKKFFTRNYEHRYPLKMRLLPRRGPVNGNSKYNWTMPFWLVDKFVVQRTQMIGYARDPNDLPVQFNSYMFIGHFFIYFVILYFIPIFLLLVLLSPTRKLLLKYPNIFTFGKFTNEGPKKELVDKSSFEMFLVGKGWKKSTNGINHHAPDTMRMVSIRGPELAYDATSLFILLSAITIIEDLASKFVNVEPGVLTPGLAFRGTKLIERLNRTNRIEIKAINNNL